MLSRFVYDGQTMAYTRTGAGKPILFLHNGGAAKEIWTEQVRALSGQYEVICLDHLGFGESDMPETGYTIGDYVARLSAFIDHLGYERISVVANCMGSTMTLLLAEQRPEIFDSLVIINPLSENTARRGIIGWIMPVVARFPKLSRRSRGEFGFHVCLPTSLLSLSLAREIGCGRFAHHYRGHT